MEYAKTFLVKGQQLLSIIHPGDTQQETGVMVIVGGPQYRVGSHRQFVQLARALAGDGITTMRFDYSGMGDSQGQKAEFDQVNDDIKAALDTFLAEQPQLKKVVLWGLCDAASAALIYGFLDERVSGLVLLNPWLRSDQAQGKAMLKFYYLQRLFAKSFWKKLLSGKVKLSESTNDLAGHLRNSVAHQQQASASYQERMLNGLNKFTGEVCWILSEDDLTAKEFEQQALNEKKWRAIREGNSQICRISGADHTFSNRSFKQEVEEITKAFIHRIK